LNFHTKVFYGRLTDLYIELLWALFCYTIVASWARIQMWSVMKW
jgi:hypothetical protein